MDPSRTRWACVAALVLQEIAHADAVANPLTDRWQVTLGEFFLTSRPTVQLDGESGDGDRVNFKEVFGGTDAERVRIDCRWRFADRHKIRAIAFDASRERTETLDESIEWGGETYPVNASVEAEFSFAILEVAYEYAFLRRESYELGASFGLHYMTLEASLEADAAASSGQLTLSDSASVEAPLPVIGLSGTWALSHDLWLDAAAQFFALSIDEYRGHLESYRASLTWQPRPWLGIGIGYSLFAIELDVENEDLNGGLDWTYDGPIIYYRASF
jgi:hypothetical protein